MIVADNVCCPGAPEYLEYVRGGKEWSIVAGRLRIICLMAGK